MIRRNVVKKYLKLDTPEWWDEEEKRPPTEESEELRESIDKKRKPFKVKGKVRIR